MRNFWESLRPETRGMALPGGCLLLGGYAVAVALYALAGRGMEYHAAMTLSEALTQGLRAGFGLFCVGCLAIEAK